MPAWRCAALAALLVASARPLAGQQVSVMYRDGRADLALARARGDTAVTLVIASRDGANAAVVRAVEASGGTVSVRDDEVSYVRARVPIANVERLLASDAIESATVNTTDPDRPFMRSGWPAPGDDRPSGLADSALRHPYSPLRDIGALALRKAHPTYDGRGITIAHIEGYADLLAEELQAARTLAGAPVRKFADYVTTADPEGAASPGGMPNPWVTMTTQVAAPETRFTYQGNPHVAPRAGTFRVGTFVFPQLCSGLRLTTSDAPGGAPPPPAAGACAFAVLWDPTTNEVWLDTDRDRSLSDEKAMRDYKARFDVGVIGRDDPRTPVRESVSFVVQTWAARERVAILVGIAGHGTMVAATAAGGRGTRGRFDGVAPGAQIIAYAEGWGTAGTTEALIAAFKDPRVDVVLYEPDVRIGNAYRLGDGRFPPTIITTRLIERYRKPFVVPGGNAPATGTISEHGNARWSFAVGAYQSKESYRINDGVLVERDDNLHGAGSWGPGGGGAVKPDVLAPSNILTRTVTLDGYPRGGRKGLYSLPPGYAIGGGSSQAAATMAGALAVLLSAAKQERVPYDAERVWLAVTNAARFIPHIAAYKQGNGVVDVGAALALLKRYAVTPPVVRIASRAPVRTGYGADLAPPHTGVGLWEREGWRAGQRGTRTITLTRTGGPPEPMTFALSWLGNNGTFAAPPTIALPLGAPTALDIDVAPTSSGVHAALLTLVHPSMPGHAYRMMTTIVASERFEAGGNYVVTKAGVVERPGPAVSYFVDVPSGAAALVVDLAMAGDGMLMVRDPLGRSVAGAGPARTQTVTNPMPGVWELEAAILNVGLELAWAAQRAAVDPPVRFTLSATLYGAEAMLTGDPVSSLTVRVANRFAAFSGAAMSTALASVWTMRGRIEPRAQRVFEIIVPEGSPMLQAEISAAGSDADLDAYLFDCTSGACRPSANATGGGGGRTRLLRRERPAAGLWKVVVDAARAPNDGVEFEYRDIVLDQRLGSLSVADAARGRAPGAEWTVPAAAWIATQPGPGRTLCAAARVQSTRPDGAEVPVRLTFSLCPPR